MTVWPLIAVSEWHRYPTRNTRHMTKRRRAGSVFISAEEAHHAQRRYHLLGQAFEKRHCFEKATEQQLCHVARPAVK